MQVFIVNCIRSIVDIGNKIKGFIFPTIEIYDSIICQGILSVESVRQVETVLDTFKVLETRLTTAGFEMARTYQVCCHVRSKS